MARLRLRSPRPAKKAADRAHAEPHLSVVPPKVDHVGLILREGREHFGANLRDVADSLRIRYVYLQAIEEGKFEELPGPTYAIGFVRAYSDFLGFDTESLLVRLRTETQGLNGPPELDFPTAPAEARFPGSGALVASLVIAGAVFGGWYYLQSGDEFDIERVPTVIVDAIAGRFGGAESPQATVPMPDAPGQGVGDEFAAIYELERIRPNPDPRSANVEQIPGAAVMPAPESPPAAAAQLPPAAANLPVGEDAEAEANAITPEEGLALMAANDPAAPRPAAPRIDMAGPEPAGPATPKIVFTAPAEAAPATPNDDAVAEVADLPAAAEAKPEATPEAVEDEAPLVLVRPNAPPADEEEAAPAAAAVAPPEDEIAALPAVPQGAGNTTAGRVYGSTNRDSRIVIIAEVDSWIQVRDSSRSDVFTRMLRAGDSYRVPNQSGLMLMTGNAGGLKIGIDGEEARTFGESGEVARDVPLDPDLLRSRYLR